MELALGTLIRRHRTRLGAAAVLAAAGLLTAACGTATPTAASSGSSAAGSLAAGASAGSKLLGTTTSSVGTMLVDSHGKAIYVFAIDKPGQSACQATCLQYWPIVPAPSALPSSIPGVTAKLGVLQRPEGTRQLTVGGYPVYTYAGDSGPGMASGQGKNLSGGLWWVVSPSGAWITTKNSGAGSPPTGGSSGGYGGYGGYGG